MEMARLKCENMVEATKWKASSAEGSEGTCNGGQPKGIKEEAQ